MKNTDDFNKDFEAKIEYKSWWDNEGSCMKWNKKEEDLEEFAKRITTIAWLNGAFKERYR